MPRFDWIGLDADDTLWHTEGLYTLTQEQFVALLALYHNEDWIRERLAHAEEANLAHFGYGIKAFALSMVETAIELSEGRVTGAELHPLLERVKAMLSAEIELLEGVEETLAALSARYPLMLITKGDSFEQGGKIRRSGLAQYFRAVEIVNDKSSADYEALFARHGVTAARFLMAGNSLRSDILPVLELGGSAVHVPYHTTWQHEMAEAPAADRPGFFSIQRLSDLPALLARLEK